MGVTAKGGMWCDQCGKPVAATKSTHRFRNTLAAVGLPLTMGASLHGIKVGESCCPNCGGPVRGLPKDGKLFFNPDTTPPYVRNAVEVLLVEVEDKKRTAQALKRVVDFETWVPNGVVFVRIPPTAEKVVGKLPSRIGAYSTSDAERLSIALRAVGATVEVRRIAGPASAEAAPPSLLSAVEQIERLAALRASGALTDDEFAVAKSKLLA